MLQQKWLCENQEPINFKTKRLNAFLKVRTHSSFHKRGEETVNAFWKRAGMTMTDFDNVFAVLIDTAIKAAGLEQLVKTPIEKVTGQPFRFISSNRAD